MKLSLRIALELERLRRKNLKQLHPLRQLFWESTLRCNVHCLHCGSDCLVDAIPDMPREDFMHILDSLAPHIDPKDFAVVITGGEPALQLSPALVQALHAAGRQVAVETNGVYGE